MSGNKSLRIVLVDPRHSTTGSHSVVMPLALGFIAAYTAKEHGRDRVRITIHTDPEEAVAMIDADRPDVVGSSNYCWNAALSKFLLSYAKKKNPNVITIAGGGEFPIDKGEARDYLRFRSDIDFFSYREGELPFSGLIGRLLAGDEPGALKRESLMGLAAIHPDTNEIVFGPEPARLVDMDVIPSPYIDGWFDNFWGGRFKPFVQFARGCPFSCTYCDAGAEWYSKVSRFSLERVREELTFIARKMQDFPDVALAVSDSNFGMFSQDIEIADHIISLQRQYKWPTFMDTDTGKGKYEQIIDIADRLGKKMPIKLSMQSFNTATLDAIKRRNIQVENYMEIAALARGRGLKVMTELISPLPEETKDSLIGSLRTLSDAGVHTVVFTTMMLMGSEIAKTSSRDRYGMETKFRLLPRQFGEYDGEKIFEIEEVCVGTNTMPFRDYLECRGLSLIVSTFNNDALDIFRHLLVEMNVNKFDFIMAVYSEIKATDSILSKVVSGYLAESENELFDSIEDLIKEYSRDESYEQLLHGEIGDNLMRKYSSMLVVDQYRNTVELAGRVLVRMVDGHGSNDWSTGVQDVVKWAIGVRDIDSLLNLDTDAFADFDVDFEFDVPSWYQSRGNGSNLLDYRHKTHLTFKTEEERIRSIVDNAIRLFGKNRDFWVARLLERYPASNFWRTACKSE